MFQMAMSIECSMATNALTGPRREAVIATPRRPKEYRFFAFSFTYFLPRRRRSPPRSYRQWFETDFMADFLVVLGIVTFVAAMLALISGLGRV
jgi:hypothetical protein